MIVAIADRGVQVLGVACFFLALATISTLLRFYCRVLIVKNFGFDDSAAVIAWIFFVFFCAFAVAGACYGTGQHVSALTPKSNLLGRKWWWACEPVYILSNMALRLSIGVMLLRITVSKVYKSIIWSVIIVSEIYGAGFFLLFVLQCLPSAYFWARFNGEEGYCIEPNIIVIASHINSAISCATDWTLGIMLVSLVWGLEMSTRKKLSLALILALGAIASVATIIRILYIKNVANQGDFLYVTSDVSIWSTVETGIGIGASNVATLRPLFLKIFARSRLFGDSSRLPKSNHSGHSTIHAGGFADLVLRNDIGKDMLVTTVVSADGNAYIELGENAVQNNLHLTEQSMLTSKSSHLTKGSSDIETLGLSGIWKTTAWTQVAD